MKQKKEKYFFSFQVVSQKLSCLQYEEICRVKKGSRDLKLHSAFACMFFNRAKLSKARIQKLNQSHND